MITTFLAVAFLSIKTKMWPFKTMQNSMIQMKCKVGTDYIILGN